MNWLDFGVKRSKFKVMAWPNASQIFMFPLYLQYLLIDFCQTFVTGASWDTDDLITFLGRKVKVQGHTIAAEAHSTRSYRRVQLFLVHTRMTTRCSVWCLTNLYLLSSWLLLLLLFLLLLLLVRERSAIAILIVSQRVCLWVCHSVCPHFQNASSPAVFVGISWYFNTMFSYVDCLSDPHRVDPDLDVSNDVMKFSMAPLRAAEWYRRGPLHTRLVGQSTISWGC